MKSCDQTQVHPLGQTAPRPAFLTVWSLHFIVYHVVTDDH
jgi:hypothetical protein